MNISAAMELAFADILRNYGSVGAKTVVRAWQSLTAEQATAKTGERSFPMIDIRATPPATEDQVTRYIDVQMEIGTYNEDDKNHSVIRALYESVQETLDSLFDGWRGEPATDVYDYFISRVESESNQTCNIGGLTFEQTGPPYDDDGLNMMTMVMRVHYSR